MSQPPAGGYPPPDPSTSADYPPPAPPYTPPGGSYAPPPGGYPPPNHAAPPMPPGAAGSSAYAPPPGYQPPPAVGGYPPPAPGYQPPPPAYGGVQGSPTGNSGTPSFDVSKVGTGDWIITGAGLVLLIFSFFGWLSASVDFDGFSEGYSYGAWHEYWWLATVLGVAVAVIVALRTMMGQAISQVKPQFLMFAAAGGFVITLISLIEIFTKGSSGEGYSVGPGFGIWVCLIVSAAQTYFVWLWAQKQPGWSLPKLPGPSF